MIITGPGPGPGPSLSLSLRRGGAGIAQEHDRYGRWEERFLLGTATSVATRSKCRSGQAGESVEEQETGRSWEGPGWSSIIKAGPVTGCGVWLTPASSTRTASSSSINGFRASSRGALGTVPGPGRAISRAHWPGGGLILGKTGGWVSGPVETALAQLPRSPDAVDILPVLRGPSPLWTRRRRDAFDRASPAPHCQTRSFETRFQESRTSRARHAPRGAHTQAVADQFSHHRRHALPGCPTWRRIIAIS